MEVKTELGEKWRSCVDRGKGRVMGEVEKVVKVEKVF